MTIRANSFDELCFFFRYFGVIAPRQLVNHRTPPSRIEDTSTGSSNHASDKESELSEQPRTVSTPFTIARGENNPTAKLVVELVTWRLVSTTPGSVEIIPSGRCCTQLCKISTRKFCLQGGFSIILLKKGKAIS